MNEALRLLDKFLKKRGYAIKKHPEYNLLPLKNFECFDDQKSIYESFNADNKADLKNPDNVDKLEVCLRTCINEKRSKKRRSELTGVSLEAHLLACINSLIISVNAACTKNIDIRFTVFDDRSDGAALDKIKALCSNLKCDWQIKTTEKPGQGPSLHEHFMYAKDKNALFYFVEDDYLHESFAIKEMVDFYKTIYQQTANHILIYPQEHEVLYRGFNYPSYILLGENRRWRTMSNATHTFFTHASVVKQYRHYFENTKYTGASVSKKRHLGSEKKTTDRLFNHIHGFSPIPAVAVHFQTKACLPPFFDWHRLWNKNRID